MFILLLCLQRVVFDSISLYSFDRPVIFFFFILVLPKMRSSSFLLLGFITGFLYDIVYHTPGINTAACVMLAFVRDPLVRVFLDDEDSDEYSAHITSLGFGRFFFYTLILSLIFHLIVTFLNVFSFKDILHTLLNAGFSTLMSVALIYIFDIIFYYRKTAVR
jgi:hypothetical protein